MTNCECGRCHNCIIADKEEIEARTATCIECGLEVECDSPEDALDYMDGADWETIDGGDICAECSRKKQ